MAVDSCPVRIDVLYFAAAREAAGTPSERVEVPGTTTVGALRPLLASRHPALSTVLPGSRLAVGERFAAEAQALAEGDVVAVIPPVSGG